ncbi:MAG: TauD/TfdA family dioxygenase [Pseudomonadales bacterium]|jgi:taurine dioxygenase|nr:TauD/TfdA family dioxygenase [Pseudomonadales bacterium]
MLQARALTPTIGAEISGVDLTQALSEEAMDWIRHQLLHYKVIFFRDQSIDTQQHIAFAKQFGELEKHPIQPKEGFPEVMVLHNDAERPPAGTAFWHSDVTWRPEPSLGSILIARKVPEVGGDTLFANMESAYAGLDDATLELIEGRNAIHAFEPLRQALIKRSASAEELAQYEKDYPSVTHPIVRTHPVSGRKSIYVNGLFTLGIEGMADGEAKPLLKRLFDTAAKPENQCRFRWRQHSIAFWDNRSAQHYANADYFPNERIMERVTIQGDRPF